MGSNEFTIESYGETAEIAFKSAVAEAQYDYGHSGYTGSIAEKSEFVMMDGPYMNGPLIEKKAYALVEQLMDADDERITDKWGPAGCIEIQVESGPRRFLFFGWASS